MKANPATASDCRCQTAGVIEPNPEFPDVDPAALNAIIGFAESFVDWLERAAAIAAESGHDPQSTAETIAGWRFVALALTEAQM